MFYPRLTAALAIVASLMVGCVDGTLPPVTSLADPSNPAAPEAPIPPPPAIFGARSPSPTAAVTAPTAAPGDVVYVCPMHAQIVRDAPGACPICGMTLVPRPRSQAAPEPHDHDPDHGGAK